MTVSENLDIQKKLTLYLQQPISHLYNSHIYFKRIPIKLIISFASLECSEHEEIKICRYMQMHLAYDVQIKKMLS